MSDNYCEKRLVIAREDYLRDKTSHDIIWGYLQLNSYIDKDHHRFVYMDKMGTSTIRKAIEEKLSNPTITKTIRLYERLGYITKGKVLTVDGKFYVDCYWLADKEEIEMFKLIPKETLQFLFDTMTENVIKIYTYLLNKYEWKMETKEKYNFTLKELCLAIGYTDRYENHQKVNNILVCLENNGLVKYTKIYQRYNDITKPVFRLDYVGLSYKKNETKEEKKEETAFTSAFVF